MSPVANAVLGLVFVAVGMAATLLMYHLWGYPYDEKKSKSMAPASLMLLHRCLGYVYLAIYVYFLTQMVPRLWNYQIEFPARTVAHLTLGMAIGAILVVKIIIVRFFKHLVSDLVPLLGTALFVCNVLLIGLSVPFAFREVQLRRIVDGGKFFSPQVADRVRAMLPLAGLDDEARIDRLVSTDGLEAGRAVLMNDCVFCHDLRTVLAMPRTPKNWRQTVRRMADRSTIFNPIAEPEQWAVTAYLIAISPELQQSVRQRREQERSTEESKQILQSAARLSELPGDAAERAAATYDPLAAKQLFETQCMQCHGPPDFERSPVGSVEEVRELVARMVENGLDVSQEELAQIIRYITENYVK